MRLLIGIALLTSLLSLTVQAKEQQSIYDLSFNNVDQETVHLSDYKGKVILLNFWATWCPPCIKEMPSMQRLREHFQDQPFEIIAINAGESATTVSSFLLELETELTFPILLDLQSRSFGEFGIRGLPMTLVINKQGQLENRVLGGKEWDEAASIKMIEDVLNQ